MTSERRLSSFPRRRYTLGPTPIQELPALTQLLGGPRLYVKRDDRLGLTGGGNKTRKLEFLVAEALAADADTLITCGAVQSNHCMLTLSAAIREGMRCRIILEERVPDSYDSDASGNNFLFQLLGAEQIDVVPGGTDLFTAMDKVQDDLRAESRTGYIIPGGGSNALGALGYVACADEILSQSFELGMDFSHIVCASGSGGTHAGLLAGSTMRRGIPPLGISVRYDRSTQEERVGDLSEKILQLLGCAAPRPCVDVADDYVGPGYSISTSEALEAIRLVAGLEGLLLDPVYTGKAMAGLIDLVKAGRFSASDNVLFLHTGGTTALFAHQRELTGHGQGAG